MLAVLALAGLAYVNPEQLVETDWLVRHASDAGVRVVDMRNAPAAYDAGHIPGAVYLSPVAIRVADRPPTFLPTPEEFEALMGKLGIRDATRVIVYDERGGIYAARLWFILNYFGHRNVALLNGGWIKWTAEKRPTTAKPAAVAAPGARFIARPEPKWVATAADVLASIAKPGVKILDARTQAEIEGKDLRGIKRGGFVPSSMPLYWEDLLDPDAKTFKPAAELKKIFDARGILPGDQVIAYCQVGMRASVDLFALHLIGHTNLRNYYGAWEEWGNRDDLPITIRK